MTPLLEQVVPAPGTHPVDALTEYQMLLLAWLFEPAPANPTVQPPFMMPTNVWLWSLAFAVEAPAQLLSFPPTLTQASVWSTPPGGSPGKPVVSKKRLP